MHYTADPDMVSSKMSKSLWTIEKLAVQNNLKAKTYRFTFLLVLEIYYPETNEIGLYSSYLLQKLWKRCWRNGKHSLHRITIVLCNHFLGRKKVKWCWHQLSILMWYNLLYFGKYLLLERVLQCVVIIYSQWSFNMSNNSSFHARMNPVH